MYLNQNRPLVALLSISGAFFLLAIITALFGIYNIMGPSLVLACALVATYFKFHRSLSTFSFTFWVIAFFAASLVWPGIFLIVGGFDQRVLIVPLIQIIMFGMGATLSLRDFGNAIKMPKAVVLGICLQFSVMPIIGWMIATSFRFEPEVAAGIILIGACSGGVASNVMAYLSKGNVALSVTMTACSTMLSPFATPFAMKLLAGRMIEIDTFGMFMSIINLIILPVAAGVATHYLLHSDIRGKLWRPMVLVLAALCFFAARMDPPLQQQLFSLSAAFVLMAVLRQRWLEKGLPLVSMAGICYIVAIIAASTREQILTVGVLLFAAALIHNLLGYVFGYWGARLSRLPESECRTVSFEVGMQNGGMGAALAMDVLKSSSAALGPVIFGTWMNLTGSALASWWKGHPPADNPRAGPSKAE